MYCTCTYFGFRQLSAQHSGFHMQTHPAVQTPNHYPKPCTVLERIRTLCRANSRASQNVQDFLLEVRATPYYKGFNNSLYYVGGSLLYLSYKGPQNPILIIKAPTLRWNKLLASARDGVISQNLREAACASLPMCLTPPCSSGCMRVSAP